MELAFSHSSRNVSASATQISQNLIPEKIQLQASCLQTEDTCTIQNESQLVHLLNFSDFLHSAILRILIPVNPECFFYKGHPSAIELGLSPCPPPLEFNNFPNSLIFMIINRLI
jgi:hypothetical protein